MVPDIAAFRANNQSSITSLNVQDLNKKEFEKYNVYLN